ncbi:MULTISPECIES: hypothetical protein [Protofrankia]|uniref:DNA recombination protein RmuC n=1 Tax=Protofrankia coriariae TaxID=1562887 RepID=A0ABR5F133_9ACTN|nr:MULTISPECIES: hypothetical protein [Protofrankia]KLL10427.1 hypothetical protein FrCorBMG51_18250 [Protofrankia coriariae]ONH33164.1 hypothetical protein BL254_20355 [Protofrankia sp. BMG5.30]
MRWLLIDLGLVLLTFVLLATLAWRLWGKVGQVNQEAAELRGRLSTLTEETAALAARLDAVEVTARLNERIPA